MSEQAENSKEPSTAMTGTTGFPRLVYVVIPQDTGSSLTTSLVVLRQANSSGTTSDVCNELLWDTKAEGPNAVLFEGQSRIVNFFVVVLFFVIALLND